MVQEYWINFAGSGDPNGPGLPAWPRYDGRTRETLVIDRDTRAVSGFRAARLAVRYDQWRRASGVAVPP
jgi:para-nitrobenzyl esterase